MGVASGGRDPLRSRGSGGALTKRKDGCYQLKRAFLSGFTLVECLVTLTLAGVVLTAAVPGVQRVTQSFALMGATRMVEVSLQWGRSHAIAGNTSLAFIVDSDGKRFYWVDGRSGDQYEGTVRFLPAGVRIANSPRRPLRFYQKGNAVPAGTFVIQGDAGTFRVVVNPAGRIRTQKD